MIDSSAFYKLTWRMPVGTSVPNANFATKFTGTAETRHPNAITCRDWPGLGTKGRAKLLRANGINTTAGLTEAVTNADYRWLSVIESSHQLRADGPALTTRARSLTESVPLPVEGRRSAMIPAWTDQSIFITIHFDPGSGIPFALGAARLYFPHGRNPGDPPVTDEKIFIVDRVDAMNPEPTRATQRIRLRGFRMA